MWKIKKKLSKQLKTLDIAILKAYRATRWTRTDGTSRKNGPTTINIGLTETTEAGTEAVIQNVSNSVLAGLKENDNITINIKSENNVILTASNGTSDNLEVLKIP